MGREGGGRRGDREGERREKGRGRERGRVGVRDGGRDKQRRQTESVCKRTGLRRHGCGGTAAAAERESVRDGSSKSWAEKEDEGVREARVRKK